MLKSTATSLKKLENIFEEIEYDVRYEKGNFQSGYCLVQDKKIIVVNKFYDTEGRINCLIDILLQLNIDTSLLSEKSIEFYQKLTKNLREDE